MNKLAQLKQPVYTLSFKTVLWNHKLLLNLDHLMQDALTRLTEWYLIQAHLQLTWTLWAGDTVDSWSKKSTVLNVCFEIFLPPCFVRGSFLTDTTTESSTLQCSTSKLSVPSCSQAGVGIWSLPSGRWSKVWRRWRTRIIAGGLNSWCKCNYLFFI